MTLPVKKKIPVWKYKGFSRKVRKFNQKKYGPGGRKFYAKRFVIIFKAGAGLKAVFKPGKKRNKEVRAYRFARFMGFDFVPPALVRTIDGEPGALKLFVEGELVRYVYRGPSRRRAPSMFSEIFRRFFRRGFKDVSYDQLCMKEKSDIFTFYFVGGATDIKNDSLVSKKCRRIVLIDNDEGRLAFHPSVGDYQWVPFPDLDKPVEPINKPSDFKSFPLEKAQSVPAAVFLQDGFADGVNPKDYRHFKEFAQDAVSWNEISPSGKIHFVRWKGGYWVRLNFKSLETVYKDPPKVFSRRTLEKLKQLNEGILRDELDVKDRSGIAGWLHRRDLLLKAAAKAQIIP